MLFFFHPGYYRVCRVTRLVSSWFTTKLPIFFLHANTSYVVFDFAYVNTCNSYIIEIGIRQKYLNPFIPNCNTYGLFNNKGDIISPKLEQFLPTENANIHRYKGKKLNFVRFFCFLDRTILWSNANRMYL